MRMVQVKVPPRAVHEEVLRREEIKKGLDDLRSNKQWFYPSLRPPLLMSLLINKK